MVRVVVSCTTLPSRYDYLATLKAGLLTQTRPADTVYLTLPRKCRRLDIPYPPLPAALQQFFTVIEPPEDYGPLSKLYGGLQETDPESIIISLDDDVVLPPDFISRFVDKCARHPEVVVCNTGALLAQPWYLGGFMSTLTQHRKWNWILGVVIPATGRPVDLIFGVGGVAYRRKFLDAKLFTQPYHPDTFLQDDLVISCYLARKGITRKVFLDLPSVTSGRSPDAISGDLIRMVGSFERAFIKLQEEDFPLLGVPITESYPARIGIVIALIIILVIVIYLYYYHDGIIYY